MNQVASAGLSCIRLELTPKALGHYGQALGFDRTTALAAIARAIAVSDGWQAAAGEAVIVVRDGREPLLAVMGRFDESGIGWLTGQERVLDAACRSVRRVGYRQIENDVERLAVRLIDRFGRSVLSRARVIAIPRGGFIALGLLATALGLEYRQLAPPYPPDRPLIVVDDCAFSGTRFGEFLNEHPEYREVVFAHLYSRPELRAAIEKREPRVVACLSAADLKLQPETSARSGRIGEDAAGSCYWLGRTEALCLPWNEPDRLMWNRHSERSEVAWRIVPPELCFKNRTKASAQPVPVQLLPDGRGPISCGSQVVAGDLGDRTFLHSFESGKSAALDQMAAEIWKAILRHGELAAVVSELAEKFEVTRDELRRDVEELVGELVSQGFLGDRVGRRRSSLAAVDS